jgi:hypothetical protein
METRIMNDVRRVLSLALPAALLAATACSDDSGSVPIDHQRAALTVRDNARLNVDGLAQAIRFMEDSDLFGEMETSLNGYFGEGGEGGGEAPVPPDAPRPAPETPPMPEEPPPPDGTPPEGEIPPVPAEEGGTEGGEDIELAFGLDEAAEDLATWLAEHVLTDDQLETEAGDAVIYRMKSATFCEEGEEGETYINEDCRRVVDQVEIRLRVTSPREGDVDVAVLVAPERHNPVTFHVYADRLGFSAGLADALKSMQLIADALAEEGDEEPMLPESMSGRIAAELVRDGEQRYTARFSVSEDVRIVMKDGEDRYELNVAATSPTFELTADGSDEVVSATWNVGGVRVDFPLDVFEDDGEEDLTGVVEAFLAGATGHIEFDGEAERLTVADFGLGEATSTLKHDGHTLLTVDLNPEAHRAFTAALQKAGEDLEARVSPEFDVALNFQFQHVADQFEDVPEFLLDDHLRVRLHGASNPGVAFTADDPETGEAGTVRVVEGRLELTSTTHPDDNVIAEAGMCLYGTEGEMTEEEHPLLGGLEARACE